MRLLALETATEACSAALWETGLVAERYEVAPRRHAALVLPMIESLLATAGWSRDTLGGIAVGRGPGGFTGVRLAASVAQGLAFGLDLPVAPVSTLAAMARRSWREHGCSRVLALIDARMDEVYWGTYALDDDGAVRAVDAERVAPPQAVAPTGTGWTAAGTGWERYRDGLSARLGAALAGGVDGILPQAQDVAAIAAARFTRGEVVAAADALPVYLRDRVARKPGE